MWNPFKNLFSHPEENPKLPQTNTKPPQDVSHPSRERTAAFHSNDSSQLKKTLLNQLPEENKQLSTALGELMSEFSSKIEAPESSRILAKIFDKFQPKWREWNEELDVDKISSLEYASRSLSVPTATFPVIKNALFRLSKFISSLSQIVHMDNDQVLKEDPTPKLLQGIDSLFLLNFISRNKKNLDALMQNQGLNYPLQILTLLSVKLKSLSQKEKHNDEPFRIWWKGLHLILAHCFQIICNFTSGSHSWRIQHRQKTPPTSTRPVSSSQVSPYDSLQEFSIPKGLILKGQIIRVFSFILESLTAATNLDHGFEFHMLTVFTLGTLVIKHVPTQTALKESKLFEQLVNCIGWPTHLSHLKNSQIFDLQLLYLEVLAQAILKHHDNTQRMGELGAYEKILDFILWTTENFTSDVNKDFCLPKHALDLESSFSLLNLKGLPLPDFTRVPILPLQHLFEVLVFMCCPPLSTEPLGGILSIMIDIFCSEIRQSPENTRVRNMMLTGPPELQLYVLESLCKLINILPTVITHAKNESLPLWETLFGPYFFARDDSIPLCSFLKKQTLCVLEFVACLENYDNIQEVELLFSQIQKYLENPQITDSLFRSFFTILSHNTPITFQSLKQLNSLTTFAILIESQYQLSLKDYEAQLRPRQNLLKLLTCVVTGDKTVTEFFLDSPQLQNALFSLLVEDKMKEISLGMMLGVMKTQHKNSSKLFRRYLEGISKVLSGEKIQLVFELLEGLRTVFQYNPHQKDIMREIEGFTHLLQPLTWEIPETQDLLCVAVLQTLGATISNNPENKEHFNHTIGYDQLRQVILHSTYDKPNTVVAEVLFDLLLDKPNSLAAFSKEETETIPTIRNPHIASVIFNLLPKFQDAQEMILTNFIRLLERSTENQSSCTSVYLVYDLLKSLPIITENVSKMISLIEILGTHSITVRELKRLFKLLKGESDDYRPALSSHLIKAMQNMALSRGFSNPESFFIFNGENSYLELPSFHKLPSKGYTFYTWIRIESFVNPSTNDYYPRVFSFISAHGSYEAFFSNHKLMIKTTANKSSSQHTFNFQFSSKKWYFLCLSHSPKFLFGQSEVKLTIDDKIKEKANLKFPNITDFKYCTIGNSHISAPNEAHSFYGQMGAIYFFEDLLNDQETGTIYKDLGPNYIGTFQYEKGLPKTSVFDGSLTKNLWFCYNCKAHEKGGVFDNTPDRHKKEEVNGKLINVNLCNTQDIKDIIHCLDGIRVLFPLFRQLDQPLGPKDSPKNENNNNNRPDLDESLILEDKKGPASSVDPTLLPELLALVSDMLIGSSTNQSEILRGNGFAVISYLLQLAQPQHLSLTCVTMFKEMTEKLSSNQRLVEAIFVNILLDFRIWVFTDYEAQAELFSVLLECCKSRTAFFRTHPSVGIRGLLDRMRDYYWIVPDHLAYARIGVRKHPSTKEVLASRPEASNLAKIQSQFAQIILTLCKHEAPTSEEVSVMLLFLARSRDLSQIQTVLNMITSLLANFPTILDSIANHTNGHPIGFFFNFIENHEEQVRIAALRLIGRIIGEKRSHGLEVFNACGRALHTFPFTFTTFNAMLGILLGVYDDSTKLNTSDLPVKLPEILPSMLQLLLDSDLQDRKVALSELHVFISSFAENRRAILNLFGWQELFLNLIPPKIATTSTNTSSPGPNNNESNENPLDRSSRARTLTKEELETYKYSKESVDQFLVQMISILLYQALQEKNGWHSIEHLFVQIRLIEERGVLLAADLQRLILQELLTQITRNFSRNETPSPLVLLEKHPHFPVNFVHFSLLIEEHMYYSLWYTSNTNEKESVTRFFDSETIGLHFSDKDGSWCDFVLASQFLEVLESLKLLSISNYANMVNKNELIFGQPREQARFGGFRRLGLKTCLKILDEACIGKTISSDTALNVCVKTVPKLRTVINLAPNVEPDENQYLLVLYHLLTFLLDGKEEKVAKLSKVIVALCKDLLRALKVKILAYFREIKEMPTVHWLILEEISEYTIPTFMESLKAENEKWQNIKTYCFKFINEIEDTSFKMFGPIRTRRQKVSINYEKMKETEEFEDISYEKKLQSVREIQKSLSSIEDNYLSRYQQESLNTRREVISRWKEIKNGLTTQRGAWGNPHEKIFWKLDKTENFSRMRLKLKPNRKFDSHSGCAIEEMLQSNKAQMEGENFDLPMIEIQPSEPSKDELEFSELETLPEETSGKEKIIATFYCELVIPLHTYPGKLEISTTNLYFTEEDQNPATMSSSISNSSMIPQKQEEERDLKFKKWSLEKIREIHLRRYLLRKSALEIFLVDQTNFFLNFKQKERNKVYTKILSLRPPNLAYIDSNRTPEEIWNTQRSDLVGRWKDRQMSNFDYLIQLNTIAGRTYNDLNQYMIFPWVIADYTSETIDLNDPKVYRDLSKPIGALGDPKRSQQFVERYEAFEDPVTPKFHYGSHYSSAGTVLYYLIRLEPFTTLFLQLQGGHFDHADRMFHSIEQAWFNCLHGTTDVKEMIPEFFYMPEFLVNSNKFNLGRKQNGDVMGDVILPPWAKGSPEEFIRINRLALESNYVSEHLHEWIDLIFGFKQTGEEAIKAQNVFFYLTYEGAINIDAIESESQKKSIEAQIYNFGQTPSQLIKKKSHPKRKPEKVSQRSIFSEPKKLQAYYLQITQSPLIHIKISDSNYPSYLYLGVADKIVTIDKERVPACHRWLPNTPNQSVSPFTFELDPMLASRKRIGLPFSRDFLITPRCFAISNDGKVVFSCGHWDNSFKASLVDSSKQTQSIVKHKDIVTCLALTNDGKLLITGSKDTTSMIWEVSTKNNLTKIEEQPLHILYGHDDDVTCIATNLELDLVVTGSKDGSCIAHTLRKGRYVWSIYHPERHDIRMVTITSLGNILMYSPDDLALHLYNVNGRKATKIELNERLTQMIVTRDSEYLLTGSERGMVVIRHLHSLEYIHKFTVKTKIWSMNLGPEEKHLFVGLQDGKLLIITLK